MAKPSIKTELVEVARDYVKERCGGLDRPHQLVIQFRPGGEVECVKVLDAPGDRVSKVEVVFTDGTRITFNSTGRPDKSPKLPLVLIPLFPPPARSETRPPASAQGCPDGRKQSGEKTPGSRDP
jgi:hypothetical protein